jgi:hypothetical protein
MKNIRIQVPKPCAEDWQTMLPNQAGKFCSNCQKTVVDFTQMSPTDLKDFFLKSQGKVCGRFLNTQLYEPTANSPKKNSWYGAFLATLPGTSLLQTETTKAHTLIEQNEIKPPSKKSSPNIQSKQSEKFTVSGVVLDSVTKEGIPGISIYLKNTNTGTVTDSDGKFTLEYAGDENSNEKPVITFQAVGLKTREIVIEHLNTHALEVQMVEDSSNLSGEVIIAGGACVRHSLSRRIWNGIKYVFTLRFLR